MVRRLYFLGNFHGPADVVQHRLDDGTAEKGDAAFKVQIKAAVIHIGGAHHADFSGVYS